MEIALIISVGANIILAIIAYRKEISAITHAKEEEEYFERWRKAQLVAELFSRKFNKPDQVFEFEKLNWELALILPKEIICQISVKLVDKKSKYEAMQVLIMIREELGIKDGLLAENIAYVKELPNIGKPETNKTQSPQN